MTHYLHNNGVIREGTACPGEGLYCKPRPVLMLDPQGDCEQFERLAQAFLYAANYKRSGTVSQVSDYLRVAVGDLLNPPDEGFVLRVAIQFTSKDGRGDIAWVETLVKDESAAKTHVYDLSQSERMSLSEALAIGQGLIQVLSPSDGDAS